MSSPEGEAKFWLEPSVSLCENYRLSSRAVRQLREVVERRKDEIIGAWKKYFAG